MQWAGGQHLPQHFLPTTLSSFNYMGIDKYFSALHYIILSVLLSRSRIILVEREWKPERNAMRYSSGSGSDVKHGQIFKIYSIRESSLQSIQFTFSAIN
jgi:hypothetical protein